MSKLAMLGGDRIMPRGTRLPPWPEVGPAEYAAVLDVLHSGRFTSAASGEEQITGLEREWAAHVGTRHCVAVANGTASLSIALAAGGVRPGDEVIVPALSFIGSALAPVHLGAVPVFVDIDPETFTLDPAALEDALSERTVAIVPVHLHGLPADMDEIRVFARRHGLLVVEDAAQAHGVAYRGRAVGALGDAGAFSLNVSKNLPTCGEGGLITADDDDLAGRMTMMRQFGERIPVRGERLYVSEILGWNAKINAVQAAFTRSQLTRLDSQQVTRDRTVRRLLESVGELPGLRVPCAPDDREHGWHILRFRLVPEAFGLGEADAAPLRAAFCRAVHAEGVPVSRYQSMPLPDQPVFREGRAKCRSRDVSATLAVVRDSFVLQKIHLNPAAGPVLDLVADAFTKVWAHRDLLARMALEARRTRKASAVSAPT